MPEPQSPIHFFFGEVALRNEAGQCWPREPALEHQLRGFMTQGLLPVRDSVQSYAKLAEQCDDWRRAAVGERAGCVSVAVYDAASGARWQLIGRMYYSWATGRRPSRSGHFMVLSEGMWAATGYDPFVWPAAVDSSADFEAGYAHLFGQCEQWTAPDPKSVESEAWANAARLWRTYRDASGPEVALALEKICKGEPVRLGHDAPMGLFKLIVSCLPFKVRKGFSMSSSPFMLSPGLEGHMLLSRAAPLVHPTNLEDEASSLDLDRILGDHGAFRAHLEGAHVGEAQITCRPYPLASPGSGYRGAATNAAHEDGDSQIAQPSRPLKARHRRAVRVPRFMWATGAGLVLTLAILRTLGDAAPRDASPWIERAERLAPGTDFAAMALEGMQWAADPKLSPSERERVCRKLKPLVQLVQTKIAAQAPTASLDMVWAQLAIAHKLQVHGGHTMRCDSPIRMDHAIAALHARESRLVFDKGPDELAQRIELVDKIEAFYRNDAQFPAPSNLSDMVQSTKTLAANTELRRFALHWRNRSERIAQPSRLLSDFATALGAFRGRHPGVESVEQELEDLEREIHRAAEQACATKLTEAYADLRAELSLGNLTQFKSAAQAYIRRTTAFAGAVVPHFDNVAEVLAAAEANPELSLQPNESDYAIGFVQDNQCIRLPERTRLRTFLKSPDRRLCIVKLEGPSTWARAGRTTQFIGPVKLDRFDGAQPVEGLAGHRLLATLKWPSLQRP